MELKDVKDVFHNLVKQNINFRLVLKLARLI